MMGLEVDPLALVLAFFFFFPMKGSRPWWTTYDILHKSVLFWLWRLLPFSYILIHFFNNILQQQLSQDHFIVRSYNITENDSQIILYERARTSSTEQPGSGRVG